MALPAVTNPAITSIAVDGTPNGFVLRLLLMALPLRVLCHSRRLGRHVTGRGDDVVARAASLMLTSRRGGER